MNATYSGLSGSVPVRRMVNLGFHLHSRLRCQELACADPARLQERHAARLIRKASSTRFGRDHRFSAIRSVPEFQRAVPIRTYECSWADYPRGAYPVFEDLTWPGAFRSSP